MAASGIISGMNPLEFTKDNPFPLFAIQLCLILVMVRVVHYPLSYIRQPRVIAEVITGIILGPTALCRIPSFKNNVFPDESLPFINLVATFGLVFFLFLVGLELDPRHMTRNLKRTLSVAVAGMAVPFAGGVGVSFVLYHYIPEEGRVGVGSFILFCGIAICITAFPVLARILAELNLLKTAVGSMTISAAAVNDAVAWILLALVISIVNASSGINALYIFLVAVGFVLFLAFVVRRGVLWLVHRQPDIAENGPNQLTVMIIFLLVLISAFFTDVLGIHPIFGGFAVGVIMPHDYGFAVKLTEKIEDFISILFLPLYFTLSGLKTQIGLLNEGKAWGLVVLVCVVAIGGKVIGSAVAARLFKTTWRESLAIGFLMNCKGLVELIALNLGLEAGVLDGRTFAILVLMALVTTFITTPLVIWVYPPHVQRLAYQRSSVALGDNASHRGSAISSHRTSIMNEAGPFPASSIGHPDEKSSRAPSFRERWLPGFISKSAKASPLPSPAIPRGRRVSHDSVAGGSYFPSTLPSPGLAKIDSRGSIAASTQGLGAGARILGEHAMQKETRLVVCVDQLEQVPSVIQLVDVFSPVDKEKVGVHAIRLRALGERMSHVMRYQDAEETIASDPVANVLRAFGSMHRLVIDTTLTVCGADKFANAVAEQADEDDANLVIIPWRAITTEEGNIRHTPSSHAKDKYKPPIDKDTPDPVKRPFIRGVLSHVSCPLAIVLDRGLTASHNDRVRVKLGGDVVMESHDTSLIASSAVPSITLLLGCGEPEDDHIAESLAFLAHTNGVSIHLLQYVRPGDGSGIFSASSQPPSTSPSTEPSIVDHEIKVENPAIPSRRPSVPSTPTAMESTREIPGLGKVERISQISQLQARLTLLSRKDLVIVGKGRGIASSFRSSNSSEEDGTLGWLAEEVVSSKSEVSIMVVRAPLTSRGPQIV